MDLDRIIAEGQAKIAARERQLDEQRQKELAKLNEEEIAERVSAEKVESKLLSVVKPVFQEAQAKLEAAGWEARIKETRSFSPKKLVEVVLTMELTMQGKRPQYSGGSVKTHSLVFHGQVSHGGRILATHDDVVIPGMLDIPIASLSQQKVSSTVSAFIAKSFDEESKL
jgi:septum formation inhibitor MinC